MSFQKKVEELQGSVNKQLLGVDDAEAYVIVHAYTVKELINAYNKRGSVLEFLFKQTAYFRRFWRTTPIDSKKLGTLLTFIRKSAYMGLKMRRMPK